jgi:hypothetical protein
MLVVGDPPIEAVVLLAEKEGLLLHCNSGPEARTKNEMVWPVPPSGGIVRLSAGVTAGGAGGPGGQLVHGGDRQSEEGRGAGAAEARVAAPEVTGAAAPGHRAADPPPGRVPRQRPAPEVRTTRAPKPFVSPLPLPLPIASCLLPRSQWGAQGLMTGPSYISRWGVPQTTPPPYLLEGGLDPPVIKAWGALWGNLVSGVGFTAHQELQCQESFGGRFSARNRLWLRKFVMDFMQRILLLSYRRRPYVSSV